MRTFAKTNEQNNRDDSFETRHFDEGRPCGEPPCTSLVQRSCMLMQKDPCLSVNSILGRLYNGFSHIFHTTVEIKQEAQGSKHSFSSIYTASLKTFSVSRIVYSKPAIKKDLIRS